MVNMNSSYILNVLHFPLRKACLNHPRYISEVRWVDLYLVDDNVEFFMMSHGIPVH